MGDWGGGNAHYPAESSSSSFPSPPYLSRVVLLFFDGLASGDDVPPLLRYFRYQLRCRVKEISDKRSLSVFSPGFGIARVTEEKLRSELQGSEPDLDLCIGEEDRLLLRRAAKIALLFSVEGEEVQEEAIKLLCEPVVAESAYPASTRSQNESLPLLSEINYLLSDRVAVGNARRLAREGHWDWGLQLLSRAIATPMVTAAAVELFGHARHWKMALQCLSNIPPAAWTEVEVSAAIRSLYHASRERLHTTTMNVQTPAWWTFALQILMLSRENGVQFRTPSAVNDVLGLLGADRQLWVTASCVVECMLIPPERERPEEVETGIGKSDRKVRPNVVSIYHTCRALRQQWYVALHYASRMLCKGDICIADDREATQRLLRVCISGNRWAEALRTIQQCVWQRERDEKVECEDCIDAALFIDVLRLLNETRNAFYASQILQQPQLSKHFSKDTTGKAYNIMLRQSSTPPEAQSWLQKMILKNALVENESHEHLVLLYAREGDWKRALSSLKLLLDDPRRRYLYIPSAKVHDAVQYALERAPTPGPSWEVSLNLLTRMCSLHVPMSEVAFQSTVKKCFAHGMSEKAQAIFQLVMRRGVQK